MPITDTHNDALVRAVFHSVEMSVNGLITDYELLNCLAILCNQRKLPSVDMLDETTGLRYTNTHVGRLACKEDSHVS